MFTMLLSLLLQSALVNHNTLDTVMTKYILLIPSLIHEVHYVDNIYTRKNGVVKRLTSKKVLNRSL